MRKQFHVIIGVFFLPMLLVYMFTGLMFMSGQRSRGEVREEIIEAEWPSGREGQLALAKGYLAERGLRNPPDRLRSEPDFFFWGHSGAFSLALKPGQAEGRVIAQIYEPTLYARLMSLHSNRARGGGFQAFAVLFCLGWLLSYAGVLFRKAKKRARWRWLPLGAGVLVTVLVVRLSM